MTPTRLQRDLYEQLLAELKKSGVMPDKFFKRAAAKGWSTPNSAHPAFNGFDSVILLMTAIELTKDSSFAIRLGRSVDITSYGTLGFALMTCANLRESILLLLRYGKAFSLPQWEAHEHKGGLLLRLGVLSTAPEHIRPVTELCFAQLSVTGSSLYRGQIQGAELQFAFPKPAHSASYKFALNVDVAFDCQYSQLYLPAHALDTPVRTSDPSQYVVFHQQCEEMLRGLGRAEKITSEVRRLLIQSAGQFPSIAGVADSLYMSERTLRRHLSRESNTFRSILEEVRNLLASEYLTKTDLAVGEIAHLLEYSETVNFRRAFLRWRGMTPSAYRQQTRP
ncbi:MAG: helix-turn-helix domain-containing protein [Halieaceae bacterium]|nr:helix-turn-helix domain-containing protein [Halieaceae bacterium]